MKLRDKTAYIWDLDRALYATLFVMHYVHVVLYWWKLVPRPCINLSNLEAGHPQPSSLLPQFKAHFLSTIIWNENVNWFLGTWGWISFMPLDFFVFNFRPIQTWHAVDRLNFHNETLFYLSLTIGSKIRIFKEEKVEASNYFKKKFTLSFMLQSPNWFNLWFYNGSHPKDLVRKGQISEKSSKSNPTYPPPTLRSRKENSRRKWRHLRPASGF